MPLAIPTSSSRQEAHDLSISRYTLHHPKTNLSPRYNHQEKKAARNGIPTPHFATIATPTTLNKSKNVRSAMAKCYYLYFAIQIPNTIRSDEPLTPPLCTPLNPNRQIYPSPTPILPPTYLKKTQTPVPHPICIYPTTTHPSHFGRLTRPTVPLHQPLIRQFQSHTQREKTAQTVIEL